MKMIKADEVQSLFSQSLAIVALFYVLDCRNFLDSGYYENIEFPDNNVQFKYILKKSGIGNPALLQMFLYILLVVPKEILKSDSMANYEQLKGEFNMLCETIINCPYTKSTYDGELDFNKINYYRHIRNAISHSRCYYMTIDDIKYVKFCDKNNSQRNCEIVIKTEDIGKIVDLLFKQMLNYLILKQNSKCVI